MRVWPRGSVPAPQIGTGVNGMSSVTLLPFQVVSSEIVNY